jgi:hypothetical protein
LSPTHAERRTGTGAGTRTRTCTRTETPHRLTRLSGAPIAARLGALPPHLILTAIYCDRYGWRSKAEYAEFVHRYGFDLMSRPGYETLANLRELMMVAWLGHQVGTN